MAVAADSGAPAAPVREPGDFARHPSTGAPYVNHPTDVTKAGQPKRVMYGRPSSFGTALDNPFNLVKWKERQLLIGVCELMVANKGEIDIHPEDRDQLDGLAARCHEAAGSSAAADRGTHIHLLLERVDRDQRDDALVEAGVALGIPAALQRRIVEQWQAFREQLGVTAIAVEMAVVNDGWRLAGTLDRLDVPERDILTGFGILDAGVPFIGDIKTGGLTLGNDGQPNWWTKYPVQLAAYADGVPYDVDTDVRGEWSPAPPNRQVALIYHYDLARAIGGEVVDWQAIPVSLDAGREGGDVCRVAADFGKRRDLFAMPAPQIAAPGDTASVVQPAAGPELPPADHPSVEAQGPAATFPAGVICARGRCSKCKRTVNLIGHQCGPTAETVVPDVIAAQAAKRGAATNDSSTREDVGPTSPAPSGKSRAEGVAESADGGPVVVPSPDRHAALLARYQQLSDADKRRYMAIKPADTDDLDAVEAALDQVDPFAHVAPLSQFESTPAPAVDQQLDEGGKVPDADKAALDVAFHALTPTARQIAARIAGEALAADRPISVTQMPTVRRWRIARAVISWASAGHTHDELWCAAVVIASPEQVADDELTLGALLGGFTLEQAQGLYDALDQLVAA